MTKQFQEVSRLRHEIDRCREEIEWMASAPIPPDELKARVAEQCQTLAARFDGSRHLAALAYPNGGVNELREMLTGSTRVNVGGQVIVPVDTEFGPLLAWLMGDVMVSRLHAEIDGMDYRPGPPMEERPARIVALKDEMLKLEQREEAIICQAEGMGVFIPRRPDADPAVVLAYDPTAQMAECRTRVGYATTVAIKA
jgi:hypothetical protein